MFRRAILAIAAIGAVSALAVASASAGYYGSSHGYSIYGYGYGHFKPSGAAGEMRLRQMIEVEGGRIAFSSLSFDVQAIVQQLVSVDVPALMKRLEKLRDLEARLVAVPPHDVPARRAVLDRLGAELDAARRIVRPYFDR